MSSEEKSVSDELVAEVRRAYLSAMPTRRENGEYIPNLLSDYVDRAVREHKLESPTLRRQLYDSVAASIRGFENIERGRQAQAERYNLSVRRLESEASFSC